MPTGTNPPGPVPAFPKGLPPPFGWVVKRASCTSRRNGRRGPRRKSPRGFSLGHHPARQGCQGCPSSPAWTLVCSAPAPLPRGYLLRAPGLVATGGCRLCANKWRNALRLYQCPSAPTAAQAGHVQHRSASWEAGLRLSSRWMSFISSQAWPWRSRPPACLAVAATVTQAQGEAVGSKLGSPPCWASLGHPTAQRPREGHICNAGGRRRRATKAAEMLSPEGGQERGTHGSQRGRKRTMAAAAACPFPGWPASDLGAPPRRGGSQNAGT